MHTAGATQAPRAGVVLGTHRWQRVCVQRRALHLLAQYGVVVVPTLPILRLAGMLPRATDRGYRSLPAIRCIAYRGVGPRHQPAQQAEHYDEQNPNLVEKMPHELILPCSGPVVKILHSSCLFFFGFSLEIPFTLFFRPRNSSLTLCVWSKVKGKKACRSAVRQALSSDFELIRS